MNPLKSANELHDLITTLHLGRNLVLPEARGPYDEMLLRADRLVHEIIEDYQRRGMEYDGS